MPLIWCHGSRDWTKAFNRTASHETLNGKGARDRLTGVRKDSATNRALAFSCMMYKHPKIHRNFHVSTYEKLHLGYFLVNLFHELYDEIHEFMLQHLFGVEVGDQERYIIALVTLAFSITGQQVAVCTLIGFLLSMKNDSARWVRNRVNL